MMLELNLRITANRRAVNIVPPSTLTVPMKLQVSDLDKLIHTLADCRAQMEPDLINLDLVPNATIYTSTKMRWAIVQSPDERHKIILGVLHRGLGWIGLPMKCEELLHLISALQSAVGRLATLQ